MDMPLYKTCRRTLEHCITIYAILIGTTTPQIVFFIFYYFILHQSFNFSMALVPFISWGIDVTLPLLTTSLLFFTYCTALSVPLRVTPQ